MKRYDPMRADSRTIDEKALGLLMAMSAEEASALHFKLSEIAARKSERAAMFLGPISDRNVGDL